MVCVPAAMAEFASGYSRERPNASNSSASTLTSLPSRTLPVRPSTHVKVDVSCPRRRDIAAFSTALRSIALYFVESELARQMHISDCRDAIG
jgi:hypothetical protein